VGPTLHPVDASALRPWHFNTFDTTGLFPEDFKSLYKKMKSFLETKKRAPTGRKTVKLDPKLRLMLVLCWMRDGLSLKALARMFYVSKATCSNEIRYILPKLLCVLWSDNKRIKLPEKWDQHIFCKVGGAVDCTSHFRNRVHPRQADYYRGDKHAHFITAQVICSVYGNAIYSVHLGTFEIIFSLVFAFYYLVSSGIFF
jgi:hypothetical protein